MKITCEYCNTLFNDTLEKCPNCGAVNKNVRRSTPDQPTTIEELEHWYKEKGLPPYEVTRFFIGQNYKNPKAFGIYKDNDNFIVYKNKADGTRAIRYEGTDEAYAVNELLTRLKQEILEQKRHNLENRSSNKSQSVNSIPYSVKYKQEKTNYDIVKKEKTKYDIVKKEKEIEDDKYSYIKNFDINKVVAEEEQRQKVEKELKKIKWKNMPFDIKVKHVIDNITFFMSDIFMFLLKKFYFVLLILFTTVYFFMSMHNVATGYYQYDDDIYYHADLNHKDGWFYYDNSTSDWTEVYYKDVPVELTDHSKSEDFWFTPTWDPATQYTDFQTTDQYTEYIDNHSWDWSSDGDADWDSSSSFDSDSDYSWDSDDSWDSDYTDWDSDW